MESVRKRDRLKDCIGRSFFRDWHRAISVAIDVCISSFFKILVPSFVCLLQTCLLYWLTGNIVALTVTLWSFKYTPHSEPRDSLCSVYLWELGTTEHSSATTVHKNKTKKKISRLINNYCILNKTNDEWDLHMSVYSFRLKSNDKLKNKQQMQCIQVNWKKKKRKKWSSEKKGLESYSIVKKGNNWSHNEVGENKMACTYIPDSWRRSYCLLIRVDVFIDECSTLVWCDWCCSWFVIFFKYFFFSCVVLCCSFQLGCALCTYIVLVLFLGS